MGVNGRDVLIEALRLHVTADILIASNRLELLLIAAEQDKLLILKNAGGSTVGYIVFAGISKYSLLRTIRVGDLPRFPYEWSEGNICLILDVFILPGRSYEAIKQLKYFLRKKRAILYIKNCKITFFLRKSKNSYRNVVHHFLSASEAE